MRETHMSSYGSIAPRKIVAILMTAAAALLPTSCGAAVPVASAPPATPTTSLSPFAQQRALILGGGGPVGRAWEIGIIKGLADAGIDLTQADLVVGTSNGAILGVQLRAGKTLESLYATAIAPVTAPAGPSPAPAYDVAYAADAVQPLLQLTSAAALTPELRIEVGRRALGATKAIGEDAQIKSALSNLGDIREWPRAALKIAAGDVTDGTMRFFDSGQGVAIERVIAAATANPQSGKLPVSVADRRYMDGSVGGANLDVAGGYGAIVALLPPALLRPEIVRQQVEAARARGEKIVSLEPDADSLLAMGTDRFDTTRIKPTAEAALRQAAKIAVELRAFWMPTGR